MNTNVMTFQKIEHDELSRVNEQLNKQDTLDVIKWAYQEYHDELVYACSFGAEGMVLIDLISKVKPNARVVFLDTHLHFKETYDLIEKVKAKYPKLQILMQQPELSLDEQAEKYGAKLWERQPGLCCETRKIIPLERALSGSKAWISGLRRDQSITRAHTEYVNIDQRFESIKICPLIHWSWHDIWTYIRLYELPYNELHDQNYPSIGCEMCTLPAGTGGDSREGRWAGQGKTECGLHVSNTKQSSDQKKDFNE